MDPRGKEEAAQQGEANCRRIGVPQRNARPNAEGKGKCEEATGALGQRAGELNQKLTPLKG